MQIYNSFRIKTSYKMAIISVLTCISGINFVPLHKKIKDKFMSKYYEKLVSEAERLSNKTGIKELFDLGIITVNELQKWVVKELYYEAVKKGGKSYKEIKFELSEEYPLSCSTIEKLIYR
jgi:hypothetical protein